MANPIAKGIDVSKHNGTIDWKMVKTSGQVDFAILRAGFGKLASQKDERFEEYYEKARAAGMPIGAYWYSYVATKKEKAHYNINDAIAEAEQEADACIAALKGKKFEYPIWYDVEEMETLALGINGLPKVIEAFCNKLEAAGYWVGVYMSASPMSSVISDAIRNRFACWVAHVNVTEPKYAYRYDMWQYSWKGNIPGINGDVDLDYCYVDYPTLIKARGKNGFTIEPATPPTPTPETKEVTLVFDGVKYTGTLTRSE